jgi:hypothetical protein
VGGCIVFSFECLIFCLRLLSDFSNIRPHISIPFCRHIIMENCQEQVEFAVSVIWDLIYRNATIFKTLEHHGTIGERYGGIYS